MKQDACNKTLNVINHVKL